MNWLQNELVIEWIGYRMDWSWNVLIIEWIGYRMDWSWNGLVMEWIGHGMDWSQDERVYPSHLILTRVHPSYLICIVGTKPLLDARDFAPKGDEHPP